MIFEKRFQCANVIPGDEKRFLKRVLGASLGIERVIIADCCIGQIICSRIDHAADYIV
jgi:hypothetical protein